MHLRQNITYSDLRSRKVPISTERTVRCKIHHVILIILDKALKIMNLLSMEMTINLLFMDGLTLCSIQGITGVYPRNLSKTLINIIFYMLYKNQF